MGIFTKGEKKPKEKQPEFYLSAVNEPVLNYSVYYMKKSEKLLYFIFAFIVGAGIGYLFYGGIGKDEFGQPTVVTHFLNLLFSGTLGFLAGKAIIPLRTAQIIKKRRKQLNVQFRDMLEALVTSLGAGKNVMDAFAAVRSDLAIQYTGEAYILQELDVVLAGIASNFSVEDLLMDFGTRSDIDDIKSFANVFKISYRKGGNLKDIIRNTHQILSDKMEIDEEIETMVTANRNEQNIMMVMPIALIAMIKMMSPEFAANFVTPSGIISTTIAVALFIGAYFIGRKILDIKI